MVRTRFAPSPTGYLHIGGVRTALFNWLFARGQGGHFILRIDDTDAQRNVAEALEPILAGFRWLGIDWDEGPEVGGGSGPYFQSERAERHREAVRELVERGHAYHDYATPDEVRAEREAAQGKGERFVYSRRFMARTAEDRERFEAEGREGVVRLKMPRIGACRFRDLVRGPVAFDWSNEQDHVVQRADGTCLYHLASAVDDHDMGITHVIRAEEHLSNTARQIFIMESLGYERPRFAHLPVVAEPGSRNKLSKRKLDRYLKDKDFAELHARGTAIAETIGADTSNATFNPLVLDFYEKTGFLPEAVLNYLLLLGWALDDRTEIFSRESMIEAFTIERVNRAPASFDVRKLLVFQERYMAEIPLDEKVDLVLPFLERAGLVESGSGADREKVRAVVDAAGDRIKIGGDVLDYADFFAAAGDLAYDEKAFDKKLRDAEGAAELLRRFRDVLAGAADFRAEPLEATARAFVEGEGVGLGRLVHPLRVAVTGKAVGFGLFETLEVLGRDSSLARIDRSLARL